MWALIGGIVAIVIGIILVGPVDAGWGTATLIVVKGGIIVLLILGGLVAIASGISDIKDRIAEKKEKEEEKKEEKKETETTTPST